MKRQGKQPRHEAPAQEQCGGRLRRKWDKETVRRNTRLVLLVLAAYLAVVLAVSLLVDGRHVRFYLVGGQEVETAYGQPFSEPGRVAVMAGRITGEDDEELPVETEGEVDTAALGDYVLVYTAHKGMRSYQTTRTVHVVDKTPPEITLEHDEDAEYNWVTGYEEESYSAWDDVDGDVTDRVRVKRTKTGVEYTVSDRAGNETSVRRAYDFGGELPEIKLVGGAYLEVPAQLGFVEPGYLVSDSLGNDLSGYVEVSGEVVPYLTGTYELRYTLTNRAGVSVEAVRTVEVVPAGRPETVQPEGKIIYLTFDDGPGPYTEALLDVLARYNVKATFFVTCEHPDYEDMVGRAYREGHTIAVHSATHNYYQIYASEEAFLEDFQKVEDMIYRQTGTTTKMLRFPGGSSNTVSSFNPGIMSRLTRMMTDLGCQYYDWNVTSGDAGETTKTSVVVDNVIDGVSSLSYSIVLQHDIKDFSVNAVAKIISWGLSHGYTFLPLDMSSPAAHHGVNN